MITVTLSSGTVWHMGIKVGVRFAAMMPALHQICKWAQEANLQVSYVGSRSWASDMTEVSDIKRNVAVNVCSSH